jgi:hypothetical protein
MAARSEHATRLHGAAHAGLGHDELGRRGEKGRTLVTEADLLLAVRWTARLSAMTFATALLTSAFSARRSRALDTGFLVAHTIHFSFVVQLALATGGKDMFPGGEDIADAGGWPAVFGIFALFYVLAAVALSARHLGSRASLPVRVAGQLSTVFIGFMFVKTYLPLVARSYWYALPAALITTAVAADVFGSKLRRLKCLAPAAAPRQ